MFIQSVLFEDVKQHHPNTARDVIPPGLQHHEVLHADDTALIATTARKLTRWLHALEEETSTYGLHLNHASCKLSACNVNPKIAFLDGTHMTQTRNITYLGAHIADDATMAAEIAHKVAPFWADTVGNNSFLKETLH